MAYDVYGIGNALVDYLAFVEDEFLIANRIRKGVMTLVDQPGTQKILLDNPQGFEKCSGGSAANTVAGIAKMGGTACYSGKVATDLDGEFYRENLEAVGVRFSSNGIEGVTGSCVSLITPDGQRSMMTHLGVSSVLARTDINEDFIGASRYLYVEGYQWSAEIARDTSIYSMELARKHGVRIAFTYSDPIMAELFRADFLSVTREYVDLLFCNEQEAMAVTGAPDLRAAVAALESLTKMVCITTGETGAVVAADGIATATPALKVNRLIDTTGAGDMYAAGVLRGLTAGFDLVSSSMIGSRMAALIVGQVGARLP